jgi:hypothetical protein
MGSPLEAPPTARRKRPLWLDLLLALIILVFGAYLILKGIAATNRQPAGIQPEATPAPEWKKFEGGSATIWLPPSYEGGDTGKNVGLIVQKLRSLGPEFEQVAQGLEKNPSSYVLWMFDSKSSSAEALTNVVVSTERVPSATTIDTYLDAALKQLAGQLRVVSRDVVPLNHTQAGRVVLETGASRGQTRELIYAIKGGTIMWIVTFATDAGEFEQRLPIFERGIRTFAIQP